jgi:hypothetical protein
LPLDERYCPRRKAYATGVLRAILQDVEPTKYQVTERAKAQLAQLLETVMAILKRVRQNVLVSMYE